ncbi:hypothetical protein L6452_38065 [Arctium lappa]|uniref:Uncharacterized protein n=1 Tax=Arctium lappa TaxID=4217 RepID=A0ACB8Y5E3_ARCLA|nr:hypothetical protein L6452_38065 [Arctium lappa]
MKSATPVAMVRPPLNTEVRSCRGEGCRGKKIVKEKTNDGRKQRVSTMMINKEAKREEKTEGSKNVKEKRKGEENRGRRVVPAWSSARQAVVGEDDQGRRR